MNPKTLTFWEAIVEIRACLRVNLERPLRSILFRVIRQAPIRLQLNHDYFNSRHHYWSDSGIEWSQCNTMAPQNLATLWSKYWLYHSNGLSVSRFVVIRQLTHLIIISERERLFQAVITLFSIPSVPRSNSPHFCCHAQILWPPITSLRNIAEIQNHCPLGVLLSPPTCVTTRPPHM